MSSLSMTKDSMNAVVLDTHLDFKCPICSKVFKTRRGMNIHTKKMHSPSKKIVTSQVSDGSLDCSKTFSENGSPSSRLNSRLANKKLNSHIAKRIPKSARMHAAEALSKAIDNCIENNSSEAWEDLLFFAYKSFCLPPSHQNRKESLTSIIKRNIRNENDSQCTSNCIHSSPPKPNLSKYVVDKVSDGDLISAVRILTSTDTLATFDNQTLSELQSKHPSDNEFVYTGNENFDPLQVNEIEVLNAVKSFRTGSSGGLDSLRPSHLQDLLSKSSGFMGEKLLRSLTSFCNFLLSGKVNHDVIPILYGASLVALRKKDGGIRPIAVGTVFRRLVAKLACSKIKEALGNSFRPIQFGFGTAGGCEAVAHAARRFLMQHPDPHSTVFLKIDFQNAFNMIRRNILLEKVKDTMPHLFPFVRQCYQKPTFLNYGNNVILSERGVQQGDPLGPALFCLCIENLTKSIEADFNCWYLDDGSIGGEADVILEQFKKIISSSEEIGLKLNIEKCELFILNEHSVGIPEKFYSFAPDMKIVKKSSWNLLGAPISEESLAECLNQKTNSLSLMASRIGTIPKHIGYFLLKNCLAIPKLTYTLRCCPTWRCQKELDLFDSTLRVILEQLTNNNFSSTTWLQATLPVSKGGLGIRQASSVALPAFLSSYNSIQHLIDHILPGYFSNVPDVYYEECESIWCSITGTSIPEKTISQRSWDIPLIELSSQQLLDSAVDSTFEMARLKAVSTKESGAWLNALPVAFLGTLMDDESFRISVGLRLGCSICVTHKCRCGSIVNEKGIHGLSCRFSSGRFSRHSSVNDLIKRALSTADIPSVLEPLGINRDDGKRPDGMSLIPWSHGKPLVWDFTCVDTVAASHIDSTSRNAGGAAVSAEKFKLKKYSSLSNQFIFYPVAIETYGTFGRYACELINNIGQKLINKTDDRRARTFLIQRISIAIQRGNAASILGSIPATKSLDEIFSRPQGMFKYEKPPKSTSSLISSTNSISSSSHLNHLSHNSIDKGNHFCRFFPEKDNTNKHNKSIRTVVQSTVRTLGLNGLENIGNTCFMNSIIQCLSNTKWLLEYLKRDAFTSDINSNRSREGALIKAFAEVIKELWSDDSSSGVVNTVSLKTQIQRIAPRFIGFAQEDAQEFLRFLLEGLHEDVNRVTEKPITIMREIDEKLCDTKKAQESWSSYLRTDNSKIVDNFVGQLKSTLKCTYCGHCSVSFDPFWDISLSIPQRTDQLKLSQCLDSFRREETLDGDEKPKCAKCKDRRKCTKSLSFNKFPKILVIHLKRFSSTGRFREKLNVSIDFPLEGLDMSNYTAENVTPCSYRLYALSNHSGTTYSGHYTAYCRHPYASTWHEYNDTQVNPISSRSLVSGDAYVLFYEQEGT